MPASQSAARQAEASAINSSAITSAASGRASDAHRRAHPLEPRRVGEQLLHLARADRARPRGRRPRRRPRSKKRAFFAWWSAVASGYGTSERRLPGRRDLPDRPARARDHEVGGRERGAEVVREREQHVVPPRDARRRAPRSRAHRRGAERRARRSPKASTAASLSARAPRLPPNTSTTGPSAGQPEARASLARVDRAGPRGDRPADDPVLRTLEPLDREREEDAPGERRGESVRQAEVRVRLRERGGNPQQPRRERPSGPATYPPPPRTTSGRRRRRIRRSGQARAAPQRRGSHQAEARPPRKALAPGTRRARSPPPGRARPQPAARRRTSTLAPRAASASATASAGRT